MAGLKFRVLLDSESKNEVFRDILIDDSDNFESLYRAIISSFGFQGDQMASFYVSNDNWDKGHEISLMDLTYDDDDIDSPAIVMKSAIIKNFLDEPDQKFILVYDFLRMWIFLVELIGYEKIGPDKPEVVLAVGMAPPEDSKLIGENGDEFSSVEDDEFDEEEDEFGFNDYDDDLSDEDYANFDDYE